MFIKLFDRFSPFLEEDTGLNVAGGSEETGAEVTEPADPSDVESDEGEEDPEPAEPDESGRSAQDAAFAEQRRRIQELERQNADYEEALGLFFDGDDKIVQAHVLGEQKTEEQVRAEIERENELARLKAENEEMQEEIASREAERMMAEDLEKIQQIDPSIKSLDDLGEDFLEYIASGQLDGLQAYYAVKAKSEVEKIVPPEPVGKVNAEPAPKDYFTREEVESMSQAEVSKNFDAIRRSMSQWK